MAKVRIELRVTEEFKKSAQHYAELTNRNLTQFIIEAATQHMNRYRYDQSTAIAKRLETIQRQLDEVMDSPVEQTDP